MARKRFRRGRKRRRSRRKGSKKKYRVSVRRLKSKKIDSLLERRIKQIAVKEDRKNELVLVKRLQIFGTYDILTNEFGPGVLLDWTGQIVDISSIPKSDINFLVNVPPLDDPLTVDGASAVFDVDAGDENMDGDGAGQGMLSAKLQGKRSSEIIQTRSISIGLRARVRGIQVGGNAQNFDGSWVHYAVVAVKSRSLMVPGYTPHPEQVLPMKRFSMERALDTEQAAISGNKDFTYKTVIRGKMFLRQRRDRCDVKFAQKHAKYQHRITFDPEDQNGQNVIQGRKLYLVLRSDVPDSADDSYKPEILCYSKLRYVDV